MPGVQNRVTGIRTLPSFVSEHQGISGAMYRVLLLATPNQPGLHGACAPSLPSAGHVSDPLAGGPNRQHLCPQHGCRSERSARCSCTRCVGLKHYHRSIDRSNHFDEGAHRASGAGRLRRLAFGFGAVQRVAACGQASAARYNALRRFAQGVICVILWMPNPQLALGPAKRQRRLASWR